MADQPPEAPPCPSYPSASAQAAPPPASGYHSYLLRLWGRAEGRGKWQWRASLEAPSTHEQRQFADLESLFAFLRTMTAPEAAPGQEPAPRVQGDQEK